MAKEFLTKEQVAQKLKVSLKTIDSWQSKGIITTYKAGPGTKIARFDSDEINGLLKANEAPKKINREDPLLKVMELKTGKKILLPKGLNIGSPILWDESELPVEPGNYELLHGKNITVDSAGTISDIVSGTGMAHMQDMRLKKHASLSKISAARGRINVSHGLKNR